MSEKEVAEEIFTMKFFLGNSHFYKVHIQQELKSLINSFGNYKIEQIWCFGINKFLNDSNHDASRLQLALILVIHAELVSLGYNPTQTIEIHDPVMNEEGEAILAIVNDTVWPAKFRIIKHTEGCKEQYKYPTLVFAPPRCSVYIPRNCKKLIFARNGYEDWPLRNENISSFWKDLFPFIVYLIAPIMINQRQPDGSQLAISAVTTDQLSQTAIRSHRRRRPGRKRQRR